MKLLFSFALFLVLFQTSFAQKYEYNILGEHFSDTLSKNNIPTGFKSKPLTGNRKAIFEQPTDSTYIYHQVGNGETIEYILNLYQICAPCCSKWNNLNYSDFNSFKNQLIYEGEYLKVALKKEYDKGTTATFKTRVLYEDFEEQTYIYTISERSGVSVDELRIWNNLDTYAYEVENIRLIIGKTEYKYMCSCL
jgi:hypothetical protein